MEKKLKLIIPWSNSPGVRKMLLCMKLTLVISLVTVLQTWAAVSYSQTTTLSINLKNATVQNVLQQVEDQSEFYFLYSRSLIDVDRTVDVQLKDAKITEVLNALFNGTDVAYKVDGRQIVLSKKSESSISVMQQQKSVNGKVTDSTGGSLPGVSVVVKGTTNGTITDADGNYSLSNIPENAILQFSFIGMKSKEVKLNGMTVINIQMEDMTIDVDEVVVTGYSVEKKKDIVGSVAIVDTKEMLSTPSGNLGTQLQGRVAGLTVSSDGGMGSSAKVRIRGFGSFGSSDPLYIIDGVPGSIDALNPNDIESVQVLKDAASASVYGARAASGVIIVTTKKGKAGNIKVALDSYYGTNFVSKNNFPDLLDAQEYGEWYWKSMTGSGLKFGDALWRNLQYGTGEHPVIPEYIQAGGLGGTALEALRLSDPTKFASLTNAANYNNALNQIVKSANTNWFAETFNPAPIQSHQITVSGGSDKATFLIGLNYFDQKSTADTYSFYKRYTLRANSSFNINKYIRVGENLQIAYTNLRNVGNPGDAWTSPALLPVYDVMGNPAGSSVPGLINTSQGKNSITQPWRERFDGTEIQNIFGNTFMELEPIKGLVIRTSFGLDYSMNDSKDLSQVTYEYSTNTAVNSLSWNWNKKNTWIWTNTANYSKSIGKNSFKLLLGTEAINDLTKYLGAIRNSYQIEDYEPYLVLNAGTGTQSNRGAYSQSKLYSLFSRFDYTYSDKYFINMTLRRDGSSKFGNENKYGYFPAVALGWRLTSEEFMKDLSWLQDLKLRASYGIIGNQSGLAVDNQYTTFVSDLRESYPISGSNTSVALSSTPSTLGNGEARWEKAITTNIGFDANLLKDKLLLNFDYFIKETRDLLVLNQAPLTGPNIVQPSLNVGTIQNKGVDINLTNRGKIFGQVKYEVGANFSKYKNIALKVLDNPEAVISGTPATAFRLGAITQTKMGYPISYFYGYKLDGFFNTQAEVDAYKSKVNTTWIPPQIGRWKIKDVSGPGGVPDNVINAYDRTYLGSPHPDFQVGLNLSLSYKNFDFSGFLFWSQGGQVFNYNRYNVDFNTYMYNRSALMLYDSWTPENPNASLPVLDINDTYSNLYATDYYVEDASYVRLKNVQLGYSIPTGIIQKINVQKLRLYVQVQNLVTFTNKSFSGLDPGVGIRGDDMIMGVLSTETPTPQQFIFGINVEF